MLYYPLDTHWNSEGREVAAAVIAEILTNPALTSSKSINPTEPKSYVETR
jgi:hypothetical protein